MRRIYYFINALTVYRMMAAPMLLLFVRYHQLEIFKWLLSVSFFTDAIDGYLARNYKATSKLGSILDSIADDLTIAVAIIGIIVFKPGFLENQIIFVSILLSLYVLQIGLSLVRYGKISGFHTYTAKIAAILQGVFLLLIFFLPSPVYPLFYATSIITTIDLLEEIVLVLILPRWTDNVKGLYWVIKKQG